MNQDHLISLLVAGAAADSMGSSACPDEHQIAGYVDGGLDAVARERFERHLADCGNCLALVGLLCREHPADQVEPMRNEVAARARDVVAKAPQRQWRFAPQWAAAAVLVLAVPILLQLSRNLDSGVEGHGRPEPNSTRTIAPPAAGLQVLSPQAGAATDARQLAFSWTEVSGSPFYDVRIVTDAGDVVIQQRVAGTTWRLPAQLHLQPGAEYFVHVDAYPSGDKAVSSDHVPFKVSD